MPSTGSEGGFADLGGGVVVVAGDGEPAKLASVTKHELGHNLGRTDQTNDLSNHMFHKTTKNPAGQSFSVTDWEKMVEAWKRRVEYQRLKDLKKAKKDQPLDPNANALDNIQ